MKIIRLESAIDPNIVPYVNYVGSPLYYNEYKSSITDTIVKSVRLNQIVQQIVKGMVSKSTGMSKAQAEAKVRDQVNTILARMVADLSSTGPVRLFGVVVENLLARMYHRGIYLVEQQVHELKIQALAAQKQGLSLVFLPCHKSHIDYLVVSYVLYRLGVALPHIVAGDNLNLPMGLGSLLRSNGAFFIRRAWGDDPLYNAIMKEYVEVLLQRGFNVEAFVEGTRSRTGKLLNPKFGILKILLDAVWSGSVKDLVIVPVSIGYDKVIETPSYAGELLGTPKQKESVFQLLNNINILSFKWGSIHVRFGDSFSLRGYIESEASRRGFSWGKGHLIKEQGVVLQALGYKVLSDINMLSVITPTALVGTALLTLRGRGTGRSELIRKVGWIREEIVSKGGSVVEFGSSSVGEIVDRAIQVLGDLIGRRNDLLEPVYIPTNQFELSFYRNQVIHLFIPEAIVCVSLYGTVKAGGPLEAQRVAMTPHLVDEVGFISQLLKTEFIFSAGGVAQNLIVTIRKLEKANVVATGTSAAEGVPIGSNRWVTLSDEERRIGRETFDFYCFLLWPFLDCYWLAAVSLYTILPNEEQMKTNKLNWVDERVFHKRSQFFGKTLYHEGDLSYFEAVNKETLANAISRLKEMGIVLVRKDSAGTQWVALSLAWSPPQRFPNAHYADESNHQSRSKGKWTGPVMIADDESSEIALSTKGDESSIQGYSEHELDSWYRVKPAGRLWEFCDQISRYRREGKNRRDTNTVAIRVLRLAKMASQWHDGKPAKVLSDSVSSKPKL